MILACPSCSTRFLANAEEIGSHGRRVRCGRCGACWPAGRAEAPEDRGTPSESRRRRRRWPAFAAAAALLAALGWMGLQSAGTLRSAWPGLAARLGTVADGRGPVGLGLHLGVSPANASVTGDRKSLRVAGRIHNTIGSARDVPLIRVLLFDAENRPVQRWTFAPPVERLAAFQHVGFEAELDAPVEAAERISVFFHEAR